MTILSHQSLQAVADSLQTTRLGEEAARALAPHIEVRVREIVQEALKFARHSKRSLLTADDITAALKLRNVEPVYGAGGKDPGRFLAVGGHPNLFFVPDPIIKLSEVIEAPLPKPPKEIGVRQHWLAIDGTPPTIPENMPLQDHRPAKRARVAPAAAPATGSRANGGSGPGPSVEAAAAHAASTDATPDHAAAPPVRAPVKHQISQELQVYFHRVAAVLRAGPDPTPPAGLPHAAEPGAGGANAEQEAAGLASPRLRGVLASLASDAGLHPVAPYFSQLLAEEVAGSLKNLPKLHLLLEAMSCLLRNPHLSLEPYIQQLMPGVLTCIVRKQLGPQSEPLSPPDRLLKSPSAEGAGWERQNHWSLREHAARVNAQVCRQFPDEIYGIQTRITKTFLKTLCDPAKPLVTQYGAICRAALLKALAPCLYSIAKTGMEKLQAAGGISQPALKQPRLALEKQKAPIQSVETLSAAELMDIDKVPKIRLPQTKATDARATAPGASVGAERPNQHQTATGQTRDREPGPECNIFEDAFKEGVDLLPRMTFFTRSFGDAAIPFLAAPGVCCLSFL
ncbi:hypothetical protein WJX84_008212 [Apatococcus fuscideae]|uniref:TATA box binding protein associated factor (TAF) histone-like fold domain-containing protein n=1 Tax=Apatococcus fuscideae TaxID=2026836 RepID=A0AAW1SWN0_9CHLO